MINQFLFQGNKIGNFSKLEENVNGVVILRCGNCSRIPWNASNCFSFLNDPAVKDDCSKKPLTDAQKPVKFFEALIQIFTNKDEWVLDGCSGLGNTMYELH